jgi:hypothetical protein
MKVLGLVLLALVVSAPLGASDRLAIRVSPSVAFAPANLVIRTTIDADNRNRYISVTAESDAFFRSSELQLDGERAPHTSVFEFRSVPVGNYRIHVELLGSSGQQIAYAQSQVNVVANAGGY